MEVKPGYKLTEVGVIPEDWEVKKLGDLAPLQRGFDLPKHKLRDGSYPVVYSNGILNSHSEAMVKGPGVVTGRSGTIGVVHFIENDFWPHNTSLWVTRFFGSDPRFIYFLYSAIGLHRFASGSGVPTLNRKDAHEFKIPVPSTLLEQTAIATALSDADDLIEALENLLAKKRLIKQGAMQELLTGKRRLPGFRGEWVVKTIADMAECLDNLRVPLNDALRQTIPGDYPYCGANGVLDHISQWCVDDNVILIAEDGGHFDEYATRPIAYRMKGKFWVNNHAHILKSKEENYQDFLFYSLVHKDILNFLASGTRAKLNKSELLKIPVLQPQTVAEQTAIATVLSDMDAEIDALQAKLDKARQIKQGMMQELLTGRIRLV